MKIACNIGDFECSTKQELEEFIKKSSLNPFDDIWLSGECDYPSLAILINGSYACVHYFLNDEGDMWQAAGNCDKDVEFISGGEKSAMPADAVISLDEAIECAKEFFDTYKRPECVGWRAL